MTAMTATADETVAPSLRTFRALKLLERVEERDGWVEVGCLETEYTPVAAEVGERYGAGKFMLLEVDALYPRQLHGVQFTVVAKTAYAEEA